MVVDEVLGSLFLAKFFKWVSPKDVTHQAMSRGFAEAVDLGIMSVGLDEAGKQVDTNVLEVFQRMQLRAQPPVNAEELLVHDGSQGQRAE